jgi:hypothetical protein
MLAFRRSIKENIADVYLAELFEDPAAARPPKQLIAGKNAWCPVWLPDGRGIVFSASKPMPSLWKLTFSRTGWQPVDVARLPFTGEGVVQAAISRQGRLVYVQRSVNVDIWRLSLNGSRPVPPASRLISSTRGDFDPQYSPDGKHIVFTSGRSGNMEIWALFCFEQHGAKPALENILARCKKRGRSGSTDKERFPWTSYRILRPQIHLLPEQLGPREPECLEDANGGRAGSTDFRATDQ